MSSSSNHTEDVVFKLLLHTPGSEKLEPCLWLVDQKTPDIPLEPFRERETSQVPVSICLYAH